MTIEYGNERTRAPGITVQPSLDAALAHERAHPGERAIARRLTVWGRARPDGEELAELIADLVRLVGALAGSPVIERALVAIENSPTAVVSVNRELDRRHGALAVLVSIAQMKPTRQVGHPEEEERTLDNGDLSRLARLSGLAPASVWAAVGELSDGVEQVRP